MGHTFEYVQPSVGSLRDLTFKRCVSENMTLKCFDPHSSRQSANSPIQCQHMRSAHTTVLQIVAIKVQTIRTFGEALKGRRRVACTTLEHVQKNNLSCSDSMSMTRVTQALNEKSSSYVPLIENGAFGGQLQDRQQMRGRDDTMQYSPSSMTCHILNTHDRTVD